MISQDSLYYKDLEQSLILYGDHAHYFVKSTLKELRSCLQQLRQAVQQQQEEEQRLLLHQMLGTCQVLHDPLIIEQIKKVKLATLTNQDHEQLLDPIEDAIDSFGQYFQSRQASLSRQIKLVIYDSEPERAAYLKQQLMTWDTTYSIDLVTDIDQLKASINDKLPEILLCIARPQLVNDLGIQELLLKYLGTTAIVYPPHQEWDTIIDFELINQAIQESYTA